VGLYILSSTFVHSRREDKRTLDIRNNRAWNPYHSRHRSPDHQYQQRQRLFQWHHTKGKKCGDKIILSSYLYVKKDFYLVFCNFNNFNDFDMTFIVSWSICMQ
jgi:hypothetical protein